MLQYYVGKVCTVMVSPTALPMGHYSEEQITLQFSGIVDSVDNKGIQVTNLAYKTKNFFFFPHVIGICEEQLIDPDDPQVEIIKEASLKKQQISTPQNNGFVDIENPVANTKDFSKH